jgi:hypothetical protein
MYYFMSFRDPHSNTNLGVCQVKAENKEEALRISWEQEINPGGEVLFVPCDEPELELNKLYSKQEMIDLGYHVGL